MKSFLPLGFMSFILFFLLLTLIAFSSFSTPVLTLSLSLFLTHISILTFSHPYSYLHSHSLSSLLILPFTECCSHACQPMVWTYSRWLSCTTHCSTRGIPSCWRHPHHPHQYCWRSTRTLRTYASLHPRQNLFYFISFYFTSSLLFIRM